MKKRISVFLTVILLCLACAFPVWAETESRLADQAGLLDTDQKESLCNTLDEISEREQVDVIIVTTNSLEGKTAQAYADDYFIDHGYGQGEDGDGILFLVDMGDRNWAIATHGYAIEAFTDAGQEYIMEQVKPYLSDGDYNEAFQMFAMECDDFIMQADEAEPYDVGNLPKESFDVGANLLIALAVGLVAGVLITGNMRRKLKTVRKQDQAASYVRQGSMKVTRSNFTVRCQNPQNRKMRTVAGAPVHIRLPRGILLAAPVENSERFFEKQNTGKRKGCCTGNGKAAFAIVEHPVA